MDWQIVVKRKLPWEELEALELDAYQTVLADKSKKILILSEPLPTYTFGRNSTPTDLLWTTERLQATGATTAPVSRGGKWTYHGPGQLLVFPILHLPSQGFSRLGVRDFMNRFRSGAQEALKQLGIVTSPGENPFGLFKGEAKLASFGLSFKSGISNHGMAVYVTSQHSRFQAIHPCGVADGKVTSLTEWIPNLTWEDLAEKTTESVKNCFTSP